MWDAMVRFSFGPRPPVDGSEEEGAMDKEVNTSTSASAAASAPVLRSTFIELSLPAAATAAADADIPSHSSTCNMATDNMPITLAFPEYDGVAEEMLLPVMTQLSKLKLTTPDSMPPLNAFFRAKSHLQLVRERLLPIGEFIMQQTMALEGRERWATEMRLWYVLWPG